MYASRASAGINTFRSSLNEYTCPDWVRWDIVVRLTRSRAAASFRVSRLSAVILCSMSSLYPIGRRHLPAGCSCHRTVERLGPGRGSAQAVNGDPLLTLESFAELGVLGPPQSIVAGPGEIRLPLPDPPAAPGELLGPLLDPLAVRLSLH